jgi:hypothetical protein
MSGNLCWFTDMRGPELIVWRETETQPVVLRLPRGRELKLEVGCVCPTNDNRGLIAVFKVDKDVVVRYWCVLVLFLRALLGFAAWSELPPPPR